MSASYVHLRVHSEFSLVDGIVRIKALVKAAAKAGMPAVALTDQCNLFGAVKFYKAAMAAGVKPIIGADFWLHSDADGVQPSRFTLLAQDRTGYRNLCELVSRSYQDGQSRGMAMLRKSWLAEANSGLIALSGGREGEIGRAVLTGNAELAKKLAENWSRLFATRFYVELQRTSREQELSCENDLLSLAADAGVPVVATNDVRFLEREDFAAHEVRVCITEGRTLADPRRPRNYSEEQYLKGPDEMVALFEDLPQALENSLEIAKRCNLKLELGRPVLPDFKVPGAMTPDEYFEQRSKEGLEVRLAQIFDVQDPAVAEKRRLYDERLQREIEVICQMKFPGYFLIVADFIQWSKENGIPVGPGRGSGAGSLVAYAMGITDLDPLQYDLLFERFLNPERVSMPDFDVDFCMDKRDRVIEYVAGKYGRERVSQIITHGTMAARAVVRDVGRVLGHPYGFVDRIAKLIPFEIGMTLEKALVQDEELRKTYDGDEEVRTLIDMGRSLEGIARNAGKHAGGVVISPTALTDFTPLYCEEGGGNLVTQFDKDDVEAVGLVKFDFLGLRTLTIIDWAVKAINGEHNEQTELRIEAIPMDDAQVFSLLKQCKTTAVFQLESRGMKELIKRLQPDYFEEIVALVALFRPGPLQSGMVDDFIDRKHGRAAVEYPHPALEPILKPTYGVILYQEQVMQIAQDLAGYTLGGADLLRRAMGKKKPEEMAAQREVFTKGALERGVEGSTATYIFDLMEKFAGYGFNKSHSAAYALLSYQTAWLKAHHRAPFMAAVLSSDMDNTDKVVGLIEECREIGLKVVPPNVNESRYIFTHRGEDTVVYGLGAIKGVGEGAVEGIIQERQGRGPYVSLFDLAERVDLKKTNRRVMEALIRSGALDVIGRNRATLMGQLPMAMQAAEQRSRMTAAGQNDLFGFAADSDVSTVVVQADLPEDEEWEEEVRLQGEKDTLGLYLTGHPVARYAEELSRLTSGRIADLSVDTGSNGTGARRGRERGPTATVGGLVVAVRTMQSQRGGRNCFVTLDDRSGRLEVAVFSEKYPEYRELLTKDRILVVQGTLSVDDYSGGLRLSAERVLDIEHAREESARGIVINWSEGLISSTVEPSSFVHTLEETLSPFCSGPCSVRIAYRNAIARGVINLGEAWRVHPTDALLKRLRKISGNDCVRVEY